MDRVEANLGAGQGTAAVGCSLWGGYCLEWGMLGAVLHQLLRGRKEGGYLLLGGRWPWGHCRIYIRCVVIL